MTALQPDGGIRTFFRYVFGQSCFSDCQFTLVAPNEGLSDYLDEFLPARRFKLIEAERSYSQFVRQIRGLSRNGDNGMGEVLHANNPVRPVDNLSCIASPGSMSELVMEPV